MASPRNLSLTLSAADLFIRSQWPTLFISLYRHMTSCDQALGVHVFAFILILTVIVQQLE